MQDAPIDGCKLHRHCSNRWGDLERIATDAGVRFCGTCQAAVHWADNAEVAVSLGREGKCVALGFLETPIVGEMPCIVGPRRALEPAQREAGLWGLLIGDAVGVPYEFHPPSELPANDAIDLCPPAGFRRAHADVPAGTWSDDGAQALALLDTLLSSNELDLAHFAANLRGWRYEGRFAVGGVAFGLGRQTEKAINRLSCGDAPEKAGSDREQDNGNGSLMRVYSLLMRDWRTDGALVAAAIAQSRLTHGHPRSHVACAFYCLWVEAIARHGVRDAWSLTEATFMDVAMENSLPPKEVRLVLDPSWRARAKGTGYVVDTLWSARIAVEETSDYASCIRRAIAFGHDTDTTAAVAGAAAGVLYGLEGIPAEWWHALRGRDILDLLLERFRGRTAHSMVC